MFYKETAFKETALGKVPEDWDIKKIGNISKIVTGGTPSTKHPEYFGGDVKWLKSGDIKGLYIYDTEEKLTELGIENSNAKVHPPNSVAIALSGRGQTRGRTTIVKVPMSCSQSVAFMIPNEGIVPEYLHYNLSRRYIEIRNLTGDLDRSGLNLHIVGRISVPIPSLNEQRGIVEVLSCFDLAFKKTGEVIAKTERLKKGLMQQLLTKGIGHKEYKYNMELGFEIPSEWSVKPTKELFYIKGRIGWRGLKRADFITEGPYLVTGVDFSDGRIVWRNCVHIPMSKFLESPEIFVQKDDILMTKDGTIGKVAYVDYVPGGKASINAHLFLIRTLRNINIHPMYIYYALQTSHFLKYATLRQVGTTRAGFSQRAFEKFPFLLPSYEEQKKIVDILSSTDKKLELEKQEKAKLERVKSSLMDLLLSGKVRVRAD